MRSRVEAEALDRDLELVLAHRAGRVERLRGLRKEAGRRDDAVGADLECDLLLNPHLHERSLGSYAAFAPGSMGRFGPTFRPLLAIPGRGPIGAIDSRMGISMPVVWSDRHRLHEPGGEIYVGVRTPGTELPHPGRADPRSARSGGSPPRTRGRARGRGRARASTIPALVGYLRSAWEEWEASGLVSDPGQDRVVPYLFPHPGLLGSIQATPPATWPHGRARSASTP